jgi:RNA polymerase sigma-70 factor, ECF subfamily
MLSSPSQLDALRAGDEATFAALVEEHSPALLALARNYVRTRALAEEVVQDTWLGVIRGLDRFEGRASLKTWIYRICINTAKTVGQREARAVPFSSVVEAEAADEVCVDPSRFFSDDHSQFPGHWALGPTPWELPDERLLSGELRSVVLAAIEKLPPSQREVIILRDLSGWSSEEVCELLEISSANQRVLLHRARTKVREAIEAYAGAVELTVAA